MQTADRLFIAGLLLVFVLVLLKRADPAQAMPLIKADMPYCFTIKNPPLDIVKPDREPHPRRPDNA